MVAAQIDRQADTLESRIERRLDDARVSKCLKDHGRDGFTPSQVDDLSWRGVDAVAEQEDAEARVFGVPVHTRGGEVGGTEGFEVQGKRVHARPIDRCGCGGTPRSEQCSNHKVSRHCAVSG